MARTGRKTGAKAMVRAAGTSGETNRGRAAGTSSIRMNGIVAGQAASRSAPRSFETGDDAADQIVAVERPKIDSLALRHRVERRYQFGELALCIPAERFGRFDGHRDKTQPVTWPAAAEDRQIGGNDRGDLGVATGRLVIGEQQDRLPRARYLDGTGRDRIGDDVPAVAMAQRRAVEAHAHAIGVRRNAELAAEQCRDRLGRKIFLLRAEDDAD